MIRSVPLGFTPTAREVQSILSHLEEELRAVGAVVRRTPYGAIHFRLPPPWRTRHLGILHAITSGRATMGAAAGSPWRVRYELKFTVLQWLAVAVSAATIAVGLRTGRFLTFYAVAGIWFFLYVVPYVAATLQFRRLVQARVQQVISRAQSEDSGRTGEFRT